VKTNLGGLFHCLFVGLASLLLAVGRFSNSAQPVGLLLSGASVGFERCLQPQLLGPLRRRLLFGLTGTAEPGLGRSLCQTERFDLLLKLLLLVLAGRLFGPLLLQPLVLRRLLCLELLDPKRLFLRVGERVLSLGPQRRFGGQPCLVHPGGDSGDVAGN
jgi:hypothetical protein